MTMSKYIIQMREVMLSNLLARAMTCHYYITYNGINTWFFRVKVVSKSCHILGLYVIANF